MLFSKSELAHETSDNSFKIVVLVFPRISNHTDFEPLNASSHSLQADLVILPVSKSVIADLQILRDSSWIQAIKSISLWR